MKSIKRNYNLIIDIKIEEIETDGIVLQKHYKERLPEGTDFKEKYVRVAVKY